MKKLLMVSAAALLTLTACSEKEAVEEKEGTEVVVDEAVADETTNEEVTEETPKVEEKENVLVLNVGGETKEVEAVTSSIGEVVEGEEEGKFSVKRVEALPVQEREEGNTLFAEDGEMKGTQFKISEKESSKTTASAQAKLSASLYGAPEAPTEMNLADYPALEGKYEYYMQSIRSDYNRYAFTKEYPERGTVLVVEAEIPVGIANEETVALIEAMAASVKYND